jgi:CrcB protein
VTPVALAAVFCGAGFGAVLRWLLSLWLNPVLPTLPLGTLAANLLGGFLVGVATSLFTSSAALAPEWRLFAITGFLGGLTTFSTFSAEVVTLLARQQYLWGIAAIGGHLLGSLALTAVGMLAAQALLLRH